MVTKLGVHGNTSMKSHRFPLLSSDKTSDKIKEPGGPSDPARLGRIGSLALPWGAENPQNLFSGNLPDDSVSL